MRHEVKKNVSLTYRNAETYVRIKPTERQQLQIPFEYNNDQY